MKPDATPEERFTGWYVRAIEKLRELPEGDGAFAAIIGHENDDGVVGETEFVEFGHDLAHSVVEALEHGGEFGIVFLFTSARFVFVLREFVGFGVKARVRRVVGEVKEEWTIFVAVDEVECFEIETVG